MPVLYRGSAVPKGFGAINWLLSAAEKCSHPQPYIIGKLRFGIQAIRLSFGLISTLFNHQIYRNTFVRGF